MKRLKGQARKLNNLTSKLEENNRKADTERKNGNLLSSSHSTQCFIGFDQIQVISFADQITIRLTGITAQRKHI